MLLKLNNLNVMRIIFLIQYHPRTYRQIRYLLFCFLFLIIIFLFILYSIFIFKSNAKLSKHSVININIDPVPPIINGIIQIDHPLLLTDNQNQHLQHVVSDAKKRLQDLEIESEQLDQVFQNYLQKQMIEKSKHKMDITFILNDLNFSRNALARKCLQDKQIENVLHQHGNPNVQIASVNISNPIDTTNFKEPHFENPFREFNAHNIVRQKNEIIHEQKCTNNLEQMLHEIKIRDKENDTKNLKIKETNTKVNETKKHPKLSEIKQKHITDKKKSENYNIKKEEQKSKTKQILKNPIETKIPENESPTNVSSFKSLMEQINSRKPNILKGQKEREPLDLHTELMLATGGGYTSSKPNDTKDTDLEDKLSAIPNSIVNVNILDKSPISEVTSKTSSEIPSDDIDLNDIPISDSKSLGEVSINIDDINVDQINITPLSDFGKISSTEESDDKILLSTGYKSDNLDDMW